MKKNLSLIPVCLISIGCKANAKKDLSEYFKEQTNNTIEKKVKLDNGGECTYSFSYFPYSNSYSLYYYSTTNTPDVQTSGMTKITITFKWGSFEYGDIDATDITIFQFNHTSYMVKQKVTSLTLGACPKIHDYTYTLVQTTPGIEEYKITLATMGIKSGLNKLASWANSVSTGFDSEYTLW